MNKEKTSLIVLAATMGNRYGGLKQPESIGPNGETVLDYSIYDAVQAGFERIIFVISRFFEEEFKEKIASKYTDMVDVEYVYQEVDLVTEEKRNPKRTHLWGSAQAVLMGEGMIKEPFGVINAVNFYQRESFQMLYEHLQHLRADENRHILVSYRLGNVVPESGGANRGICEVDDNGFLLSVPNIPVAGPHTPFAISLASIARMARRNRRCFFLSQGLGNPGHHFFIFAGCKIAHASSVSFSSS